MKILNVNICLRIIVKVVIFTFIMALFLTENVKTNLNLLTELPVEVLQDFCKLAVDYINKGPSVKLYQNASQKLELDVESVQDAVESLVYLLVECCIHKVNEENFLKTIFQVNFTDEQAQILSILYTKKQTFISHILAEKSVPSYSYFRNLQWRFEANIGSRALLNQMEPIFTLHLQSSDSPVAGCGKTDDFLLQADPKSIIDISNKLEKALQEIQSSHTRKIQRKCK